jgi:hypothetical protein
MSDHPVISTQLNVLLRDRTQGDICSVYISYSSSICLSLHFRSYTNSKPTGGALCKLRLTLYTSYVLRLIQNKEKCTAKHTGGGGGVSSSQFKKNYFMNICIMEGGFRVTVSLKLEKMPSVDLERQGSTLEF